MGRKIWFTATVEWNEFPTLESLIKQGGGIVHDDFKVLKDGELKQRKSTKGVRHNVYKKKAEDIVFDCFKGNKGIPLTIDQIKKALSVPMPKGTISGCLAKLQKAKKIEHADYGKWKLK